MVSIPNLITVFRVFLVPVFIMAVFYGRFKIAFLTFLVASVSDALDGYLARRLKQITSIGIILDPIADKALIDSGYILFSFVEKLIPVWLSVTVISRDLLIIFGGWLLSVFGKVDRIRPSFLGKLTAFLQFITVLAVLIRVNYGIIGTKELYYLFYLTAAFTAGSAVHYTYKGIRELNGE